MKGFRRRAVLSVGERIQENQARQAAEEEAKKKAAMAPKGNRKQRRAQARFNMLLNRKLNKANSLGQGVTMSVAPDGGIEVKVAKQKPAPLLPEPTPEDE